MLKDPKNEAHSAVSARARPAGLTWLAYVRWKALLSEARSLNCSRPTSPSPAMVSCADSAGTISCSINVRSVLLDSATSRSQHGLQPCANLTCISCISSLLYMSMVAQAALPALPRLMVRL